MYSAHPRQVNCSVPAKGHPGEGQQSKAPLHFKALLVAQRLISSSRKLQAQLLFTSFVPSQTYSLRFCPGRRYIDNRTFNFDLLKLSNLAEVLTTTRTAPTPHITLHESSRRTNISKGNFQPGKRRKRRRKEVQHHTSDPKYNSLQSRTIAAELDTFTATAAVEYEKLHAFSIGTYLSCVVVARFEFGGDRFSLATLELFHTC